MKHLILFLVVCFSTLTVLTPNLRAAESTDAKAEMQALVERIKTKLQAGQQTEAELAPEIKDFDALIAKYQKTEKETAAQMRFMEAMLYMEVFQNPDKATELLSQIEKDNPGSKIAQQAGAAKSSIAGQAESMKIQKGLAVGKPFPNFETKDLDGKPLSVAAQKGNVVLIDFWATWCGPCVQELPNVLKAYDKYHSKGFNIIGISLDKDKDALTAFLKEHQMTWPQYFDGLGWENEISRKYGINSIPATYLLNRDGIIVAKGLRGEALDAAIEKALSEK